MLAFLHYKQFRQQRLSNIPAVTDRICKDFNRFPCREDLRVASGRVVSPKGSRVALLWRFLAWPNHRPPDLAACPAQNSSAYPPWLNGLSTSSGVLAASIHALANCRSSSGTPATCQPFDLAALNSNYSLANVENTPTGLTTGELVGRMRCRKLGCAERRATGRTGAVHHR